MSEIPTAPASVMAPLAVTHYTATSALGRGRAAHLEALRAGRSGLRPNDLGPFDQGAPLPTWIGRVAGVEDAPLPAELAEWECRNNRLAWLALQHDGLLEAVQAARARHGASRVAIVMGTSTASIGARPAATPHKLSFSFFSPVPVVYVSFGNQNCVHFFDFFLVLILVLFFTPP